MANILFVDDEELLCDLAHKFLTLKEYHVDTALDYQSAMDLLPRCEYDVALIDINMPGEYNGLDLLREIDSEHKEIQVILITGSPTLDSATEAVRFGAFDYLLKPFDMNVLSNVIEKALHEKRLEDENRNLQRTLEKYQGMLEKTLMEQIHEIRYAHETAKMAHVKSLRMLAKAAEYHDDATSLHIQRVGEYSRILAKNLGLSEEEQDILRYAAPMHDVGKVGIPYQVLTKPGKLSETEFALIQEHCIIGHDILKDEEHPYHKAASTIALSHHEKYNGNGYPNRLRGEAIPLYGRIVAVVDVFDALVSKRVYKTAWPIVDAINYIRDESGNHFDPDIAECFLDSFEELEIARQKINQQEQSFQHHRNLTLLKDHLMRNNYLQGI